MIAFVLRWLHATQCRTTASSRSMRWLRVRSRTRCRGHVTTTFTGRIELQVSEVMARTLSNTSHHGSPPVTEFLPRRVYDGLTFCWCSSLRLLRNSTRTINPKISNFVKIMLPASCSYLNNFSLNYTYKKCNWFFYCVFSLIFFNKVIMRVFLA